MPRELFYPVLDPQTYARLGIASPAVPRSRSGLPYLTGTAVTGPGGPSAPPGTTVPGAPAWEMAAPGAPAWEMAAPGAPAPPGAAPGSGVTASPRRDRTPLIIATATALIVAIIVIAAGAILLIKRSQANADPDAIRAVVAAETSAYNNRDFPGLLRTRCAADRMQLTARLDASTFAATVDGSLGPGGRWAVGVTDIEVNRGAGTATAIETSTPVAVATGLLTPTEMVGEVHYRKEAGQWLKCTSAGSPGIR